MKQKYSKKIAKFFNSLIGNTLVKLTDNINNYFKKKKIVKYFNLSAEKTIGQASDKINFLFSKKFRTSNFNKFLITSISLLFFYLFYLSIPNLYDKSWTQKTIENKLLEDFKINFSISSEITYNILPKPHFLIRNSKIIRKKNQDSVLLSEIKNLKVFISQKKFFDKEKMFITEVLIDDGNFFLKGNDLKILDKVSYDKFSDKEINIKNSDIFFKNDENQAVAIIKIFNASIFYDDLKILNLVNLKGEVFKIPFVFDFLAKPFNFGEKEFNIEATKLNLNFFSSYIKNNDNSINGLNTVSVLNSKIYTKYFIKDNLVTFKFDNVGMVNSNINYGGSLSVKPFDFKLDLNLKKYSLSKLLDINSIAGELIKTKLLFNENITSSISININSNNKNEVFTSSKINFNVVGGKINFDKTKLFNKKIGFLEVNNSDLYYENDKLILNTDVIIEIKNSDKLFSFFQTPRNFRKQINTIFLNFDYDILMNQIYFNTIEINDNESNEQMSNALIEFNNIDDYNLNKSRIIINKLFSAYSG